MGGHPWDRVGHARVCIHAGDVDPYTPLYREPVWGGGGHSWKIYHLPVVRSLSLRRLDAASGEHPRGAVLDYPQAAPCEGWERQQLKWFLFAAASLTAFLSLVELELLISNLTHDFWNSAVDILPTQVLTPVSFVLVLALLAVPFFTYIAILKHRLYDIDIINRSLVYGALTVVIASIFEAVDAAVHYFLLAFTHQEESILSVIVAALAIAALFDPVKHRIRRFADRRMFGEAELRQLEQSEHRQERGTTP